MSEQSPSFSSAVDLLRWSVALKAGKLREGPLFSPPAELLRERAESADFCSLQNRGRIAAQRSTGELGPPRVADVVSPLDFEGRRPKFVPGAVVGRINNNFCVLQRNLRNEVEIETYSCYPDSAIRTF